MHGALLFAHVFLYYIFSSGDHVDYPVIEWAQYVQTMVALLNYSSFNYKEPTYFLCRQCKVFCVGCVRCFFYGNRLNSRGGMTKDEDFKLIKTLDFEKSSYSSCS
jgi:hypothetical protein